MHQAINTGDPDQAPKAMFGLGVLEDEQGDPGKARHWYQQAIGTGHPEAAPKAMVNLGFLEDTAAVVRDRGVVAAGQGG